MNLTDGGQAHDWFFMAMIDWSRGKQSEARKWFDRATAWVEHNRPNDTELRSIQSEAAALIGSPDPKPKHEPEHVEKLRSSANTESCEPRKCVSRNQNLFYYMSLASLDKRYDPRGKIECRRG